MDVDYVHLQVIQDIRDEVFREGGRPAQDVTLGVQVGQRLLLGGPRQPLVLLGVEGFVGDYGADDDVQVLYVDNDGLAPEGGPGDLQADLSYSARFDFDGQVQFVLEKIRNG